MHKSMIWLRQIAQLSTTISQAQSATAFHFFTSNLFLTAPAEVDATEVESTSIPYDIIVLKLKSSCPAFRVELTLELLQSDSEVANDGLRD